MITGTCEDCPLPLTPYPLPLTPYPLPLTPSPHPLLPLDGRGRLVCDVVKKRGDPGDLQNGLGNALDDRPRQARILRRHAVMRFDRPDDDRRLAVAFERQHHDRTLPDAFLRVVLGEDVAHARISFAQHIESFT